MLTHEELLRQLRRQAKEYGSQKALAIKLGISEQYLSEVLSGKKRPNAKVLRAMGMEMVLMYKQVQGRNAAAERERKYI